MVDARLFVDPGSPCLCVRRILTPTNHLAAERTAIVVSEGDHWKTIRRVTVFHLFRIRHILHLCPVQTVPRENDTEH